ncbi:MAG: hypothetical protein H5T70_14010, partial [Chloroflexi bacterium]|nr:hypothetical protein [Chloroflexota bacterium]
CNMLALFIQPSEHGFDIPWGNGLYDMTSLIASSDGMGGQASEGWVLLSSDGDRVTFSQGMVSGLVWVRERTKSGFGSWSAWNDTVSTWSAYNGEYTVRNSESNSWYHWNKVDRDTYVFVTEGPDQYLLPGTYTFTVEAPVAHDKDTSDNTATCALDISGPPPPPPLTQPTATP